MSLNNALSDSIEKQSKTISGIRESSPKVIFNGLVKLIEAQKRFSKEFGLPHDYVFSHGGELLKQGSSELVLRRLLKNGEHGTEQLTLIVTDILEHHLTLYKALDEIACEALRQIDPQNLRKKSYRIFFWRPFSWFPFKKKHKALMTNPYLRHHEVVVSGLCHGYVRNKSVNS